SEENARPIFDAFKYVCDVNLCLVLGLEYPPIWQRKLVIMFDLSGYLKKGVVISLSVKAWTSIASLLTTMLLASLLEIGVLGQYFLVFSAVNFIVLLAKFGNDFIVVREVSKIKDSGVIDFLYVIKLLKIPVMLPVILALLVASFGLSEVVDVSDEVVYLSLIWAASQASLEIIAQVFKAKLDITLSLINGGLLGGILFLAILYFGTGQSNLGLYEVIQLQAICFFVALVLSISMLSVKYSNIHTVSAHVSIADLYPFIFSILMFVLIKSDLWIVKYFYGSVEVGIYGAALRIIVLVNTPLYIVDSVLSPLIARYHHRGEMLDLERVLRAISTVLFLLGMVLFIFVLLMGPTFLEVIFGLEYSDAYLPLLILMAGYWLKLGCGSGGIYLLMTYRAKALAVITFMSSFVGISVSIALTKFGLWGVAVGTVVSLVMQNVIIVKYIKVVDGVRAYCYYPSKNVINELRELIKS
ncbi:MAG: hypothetical protein RPR97_13875, partial [Colwellia sp.]